MIQTIYNNKTLQRRLQMGIVVLMGFLLLAGCGAQKTEVGTNEQASLVDTPEKPVMNCTIDPGANPELGVQARVYIDQNGPQYDKVRAKLYKINDSINIHAIKFTSAVVAANNEIISKPDQYLVFNFENKVNGQTFSYSPPASGPEWRDNKTLLWVDAKDIAKNKMRITGTSNSDILNNTQFAIQLPDASEKWTILTALIYFKNSSGQFDSTVAPKLQSVLIPPVYANPSQHADGKPQRLINLHPFKNITGWTADKYRTEAEKFCF